MDPLYLDFQKGLSQPSTTEMNRFTSLMQTSAAPEITISSADKEEIRDLYRYSFTNDPETKALVA